MTRIRTRFAPSPTGRMHVGNLRTALYAYLIAKHEDGDFLLRIEDTDQERYVEGATDVIYNTLKTAGITHDEGPDKPGQYGPYVQSERLSIYKPYAEQLVKEGERLRLLPRGEVGAVFLEEDDGIECYNSIHTQEDITALLNIAKQNNLLVTAGSDYHGPISTPFNELGKGRNNHLYDAQNNSFILKL